VIEDLGAYTEHGLLAVTREYGTQGPDLAAWGERMGVPCVPRAGGLVTWGRVEPSDGSIPLARGVRVGDVDLAGGALLGLAWDGDGRAAALPPAAGAAVQHDTIRVTNDTLGFRALYARTGTGWSAVSTSARALHLLEPSGVDPAGLALLATAGWHTGVATMFDGVTAVAGRLTLADGRLTHEPDPTQAEKPRDGSQVTAAASLLRQIVTGILDDHPDAVLQLTGGIDSRILLAAIPADRRAQVTAMTLATPGNADPVIAADLTARYGMRHELITFDGLEDLPPDEAFALCLTAVRRLDGGADPLAAAAVDYAEGIGHERVRLGGLGGEVARGFYYFGSTRQTAISPGRIARLADWRVFANEAAPADAFFPEVAAELRVLAHTAVREAFADAGTDDWFRATDHFYLHQRMRRWAGTLASATCMERVTLNPMLDPRFVALVGALAPEEKKDLRFLARLLLELDDELAAIPMDNRPAPAAYAGAGTRVRVQQALAKVPRVARKVRQRLARRTRPPEGGAILAAKIGEHLASHPELLAPLSGLDLLDPAWLDGVAEGTVRPDEAGCALLLRLMLA
jgi:asparagine synthase (glutamine-hydrolysing)